MVGLNQEKTHGGPLLEPVEIPITDTLDLHTFRPGEVGDLLRDYFSECVAAGIPSVRLIHGKGHGILKKRVHAVLKKNPYVASYKDAPPEAGGWGATLVVLKEGGEGPNPKKKREG